MLTTRYFRTRYTIFFLNKAGPYYHGLGILFRVLQRARRTNVRRLYSFKFATAYILGGGSGRECRSAGGGLGSALSGPGTGLGGLPPFEP